MTILSAAKSTFGYSVPTLVAGGGACGLVAALAAHDAGQEVVVIERDPLPRGSTSMSLGALCAAGSADQARHGVEDNADIFLADVMAKTKGTADPVVARAVGAMSGPMIDWLRERHDVLIALDTNWPPAFGHSRMRMHVTPGRSGADLIDQLLAACDRAEIPIVTNARLTGLFADDRTVAGIRTERPDGSVEDIGCDRLILATCGFGGNHAMIERFIPAMAEARYFGWEGNQGDGIRLGAELGGALADMDAYQGLGLLADPAGIDLNPRFLIEGGIQVNRDGLRFSNELDDVSGQGARVIAQPGSRSWVIYDQRIHANCFDLPQYVQLCEVGGVIHAESLAELADRAGINPVGLAVTLASIPIGETDSWGRSFTGLALAPPFYAARVAGAIFHTQGGLTIDAAARVVDAHGQPFPNLFAGGGAARGISGRGASGYLPGAGLASAMTLGHIAGKFTQSLTEKEVG
ncbi:FAD-binding protein [Sphingomonas sp.]|uniref:FAD-dependent oxidoreductase n=1 Tax=Sphingomonas sp. TaxID=28214 RepID=UPI0025D5BBAD|nr:FAD-binding protein [Sphingomonas sp.]